MYLELNLILKFFIKEKYKYFFFKYIIFILNNIYISIYGNIYKYK